MEKKKFLAVPFILNCTITQINESVFNEEWSVQNENDGLFMFIAALYDERSRGRDVSFASIDFVL